MKNSLNCNIMQLLFKFIHVLLFTSFFQPLIQKNDTDSFFINGRTYYLGKYNEVFMLENDSLIRIDNSLDGLKNNCRICSYFL